MEINDSIEITDEDGDCVSLSVEEARELWERLDKLFGNKEVVTYPIYPNYPVQPWWENPSYPNYPLITYYTDNTGS